MRPFFILLNEMDLFCLLVFHELVITKVNIAEELLTYLPDLSTGELMFKHENPGACKTKDVCIGRNDRAHANKTGKYWKNGVNPKEKYTNQAFSNSGFKRYK